VRRAGGGGAEASDRRTGAAALHKMRHVCDDIRNGRVCEDACLLAVQSGHGGIAAADSAADFRLIERGRQA